MSTSVTEIKQMTPKAAYGKVQLAALTPTPVPTTSLSGGRSGIYLQNLGIAPIYVGFDTSLTDANGVQVPAGGSLFLELAYNIEDPPSKVYAYSVAGQTSPADTRYMEIL